MKKLLYFRKSSKNEMIQQGWLYGWIVIWFLTAMQPFNNVTI